MKKQIVFLFVLLAATVWSTHAASHGDTDGNGVVDIGDINVIVNVMLGQAQNDNADVDGNGTIDISDVNRVINVMLGRVPGPGTTTTYIVNGVSFKMVEVEGGTFTMGATAEQGREAESDEYPAHQVTLSSYSIGQTEVTQELWQAVMGSNPSYFTGNLRPVEWVSWNDCQTFITKLNQMTGKNFRLPTEAEWEYAARGGNRSQGYKYAGSNNVNDVAWYWYNSNTSATRPVATKSPNELGLYDMSGNVWEWCQDWYGGYSSTAQTNPTGSSSGSDRVRRGGSWNCYARDCRVSNRGKLTPSIAPDNLGLRLAL